MKLNKILQFLGVFGVASLLLTACIKEEDHLKEMGENIGNSFLKFQEAPEKVHFFAPFTDQRKVDLFSLRKEVNGQAALQTTSTVTITSKPQLIEDYNDEHGSNYELLPDSLYTLSNTAFVKSANGYTVNFGAGDFSRDFTILLNGAKWDISRNYAVAFTITDSAGLDINDGKRDVIAMIAVKNQWDGIYSVESGTVTRYTAPGAPANDALSGDLTGNPEVTLATVGPNTVQITGLQWAHGNNSGVAGIDNLRATIDPVTNLVTMRSLGNATLRNWEGKENRYDPDTQTFYLGFIWNPTANVRTYEMVIKYKEPR
ncbi:DUF1735 domain-containing protein [Pseudocnuella soli]|uniref:DUF1735 domain-containing protein n=1 Tax=Pseudocnuella soli TaxID=2502779 RepID=UPI0010434F3F|nr:DUF1735 domain-containing protein [Pseudocnuella soli]